MNGPADSFTLYNAKARTIDEPNRNKGRKEKWCLPVRALRLIHGTLSKRFAGAKRQAAIR